MTRLKSTLDFMFLDGFRAAPRLMSATLAVAILSGLAHASFPLGFKFFIDAAVAADVDKLLFGVILSGALITTVWLTSTLDANIGFGLIDRMELFVSTRIAQRVSSVMSIEHLERPEYLAQLELLEQNRYMLREAPRQTLTAVSSLVRGTAMVVLLASVHPVLSLLPVAGIAPALAQSRAVRRRQRAQESCVEHMRLADQLFSLTSTAGPAKELRVYGLSDELRRRHDDIGRVVTGVMIRSAVAESVITAVGWLVFVSAFVGAMALVIQRAVAGDASPGDVVLAVVLAQEARQLLAVIANDVVTMVTTARTAARAAWLDDYVAAATRSAAGIAPPSLLRHGIAFRDVSFRYPGTDVDVLEDLDVQLPAGSSVAIVGENGAGKTTLVKLLTGMYSPTKGSVCIDEVDLDSIALEEWRNRTTAAFQDHVAFELLAAEVVGVGDLPRIDDRHAITSALDQAGATDVIRTLDDGLDTQLGRSFPSGRDLSGGQWQKLALGRGMMRDEPLLVVLDEPTASLDAETEHALFEHFIDAARRTRGTTGGITVIVSHRFSNARAADLIIVLFDGRAVEVGSHRELMEADGTYAELFRLQARGYAT